ncbi:MAG: hypothetical protein JXA73_06885 [Acidobacteria bacterium]|nr:hypothetical protein [Acidobacteriota bacterium]
MQLPIGPDPKSDARFRLGSRVDFDHRGATLSIESQLKLRELYNYIEVYQAVLREIKTDLFLFESNSENVASLQRASEMLEEFCIEADSWGFNSLYEIGLSLQMLLINSQNRIQNGVFWDTLKRGLAMLSDLLEQCEIDFRWRLAVADMLDSLNQVSRN